MLVVEQEDQTGDGETVMEGEEQMGHELDHNAVLEIVVVHLQHILQ